MSVCDAKLYRTDGTWHGSYVYLLLCRDGDGPIYAKIGISDSPLDRFASLRNNCAVEPRQFMYVHCRSRRLARTVESELHDAFKRWRVAGEWFKLDLAAKPEFNAGWREVFSRHNKVLKLQWERINVRQYTLLCQRRRNYIRSRFRFAFGRSQAFRDAVKDGACKTLK